MFIKIILKQTFFSEKKLEKDYWIIFLFMNVLRQLFLLKCYFFKSFSSFVNNKIQYMTVSTDNKNFLQSFFKRLFC